MKRFLVAALLLASTAHADTIARSWNYLTTGNGHGFQVYDSNLNKIVKFLNHPYRYLAPGPDPKGEGISRRNLAYDFYFGVKGGGSSGWLNAAQQSSPEYLNQSNIIHAPSTLGAVQADSYFFAPFGYEGNAMIAVLKAPTASDAFVLFNFHMGATGTPDAPGADGESISAVNGAVVETGPGGGAMIYVPLNGADHQDCSGAYAKVTGGMNLGDNTSCSGSDVVPAFQKTLGSDGMMAVAVAYVDNPSDAGTTITNLKNWANNRAPQKLIDDALAEMEGWRKAPPADILCNDNETKVWRQSEVVLRMGQIREPNTATRVNHGMILASLPPGEWHTGWVRDATYATVALARMGHTDEAKMSLDFFLNAGPVGKYQSYVSNVNYKISVVRYFGSGEEEADYSGQQTPNIEIDGWGLFMWAVRAYVEATGDMAWLNANYAAIKSGVADALEANLETNKIAKADSSIWEVHDANKKHFAYTTITSARGFCDLGAVAGKAGNMGDQMHYQVLSSQIKSAFLGAFIDTQGGLSSSLESVGAANFGDADAAVAEAFTMNILPDFTGNIATSTLSVLSHLQVPSGGFRRNNNGQSDYDNNEWILVDLRISDSLRRAGRGAEADTYLKLVIDKAAANFFLLPELYNAVSGMTIGVYTGSIPMVGYGGGAYVMTMLDRAGLIEANDCGDGMGTTLPMFTCMGGSTGGDGGSGGGGGDGGSGGPGGGNPAPDVPYVPACYCDLGRTCGPLGSGALILFAAAAVLVWRLRRKRA
jgi:GH15 family glucan-1,4-alpha-glucosidase